MSVLIKDMKMPESCYYCPLETDYGTCGCFAPTKDNKINYQKRPDLCPLKEIPPHGRLIEKNAVFKLIQSMPSVDKLLPVEFMKALQEIPTVIPAEEGET